MRLPDAMFFRFRRFIIFNTRQYMQILFYLKQWHGTKWYKTKRFYHFSYYQLRRLLTKRKYIATFELTSECNLRCKHCYYFKADNPHQSFRLSLAEWEQKFRALYRSGIRSVLLFGGEPTLRKDIILKAITIFPYVDVCTNGILKVPDEYRDRIILSLDGSQSINDSIRGEGVFQKVLQNYAGNSRVVISMTITNDNHTYIEDVLKLAVENNFIGVGFDIYSSKQGPEDAMYISPDTRKEIIAKLRILKKKYPNHLLLSHNALNWFEEANHTDDKCYWKTEVLHFNAALEQIRGCEYLDCSNCGCYSGANGSNINFILRWEDKLSRFNPFVNCQ